MTTEEALDRVKWLIIEAEQDGYNENAEALKLLLQLVKKEGTA